MQQGQASRPLLNGPKHYVQLAELGHGTFGMVVKALDIRTVPPSEVAIKMLPRGDFIKNYKTYVKREIQNQSLLRHPLIVSIREVFLTREYLAISMEFAQGGDLFAYTLGPNSFGKLAEVQARWIFQQLILGLDYCHRKGVANRDLKLENLLLDRHGGKRPLLKIADFGYSKHEMNSSAKTGVGTPVYMAPEVILGDNKYDAKKADIWSCGIILYAMLYGQHPFQARDPSFAQKVVRGDYPVPADIPVSPNCLGLLKGILVPDPKARMSMTDIKQHPWFLQGLPPGSLQMNDYLMQGTLPVAKYEAQIDAIVEQAQHVGRPDEGLWCCTI